MLPPQQCSQGLLVTAAGWRTAPPQLAALQCRLRLIVPTTRDSAPLLQIEPPVDFGAHNRCACSSCSVPTCDAASGRGLSGRMAGFSPSWAATAAHVHRPACVAAGLWMLVACTAPAGLEVAGSASLLLARSASLQAAMTL